MAFLANLALDVPIANQVKFEKKNEYGRIFSLSVFKQMITEQNAVLRWCTDSCVWLALNFT